MAATQKNKKLTQVFCLFLLNTLVSCTAHHDSSTNHKEDSYWYTSIDGHFSVETPASLEYRQDTLTVKKENKSFTMDLGVHHGSMRPWFFEVLHTEKPAFWTSLSIDEKSWWLKTMVDNRYKPFTLNKETQNALYGEQGGRALEIRVATSKQRLYLLVAAVPPGALRMPEVQSFFDSFQIND